MCACLYTCILSSYALVGILAFVNNLQILRTGQAFILEFCGTSRKISWKQSLRADQKKKLLKSRQSLKSTGEGINFLEMLHPRSLQVYLE